MAVSPEQAKKRRRRTRPKRIRDTDGPRQVAAPLQSLAPAKPLADKLADEPLSAGEVAEMKEHFKFLRQHRKLLKLRLNATEDLLLNGVREPSHRGVCQHLLAKVEKDRVLTVTERLPPGEAAKLLAGVLRFAPEVSYVLRYLECVSDASSQPEAAAALVHAVRRIRFTETSSAQVRQILTLIVSVFPREELPVLLFNWLYHGGFRQAIDRASETLPVELAEIVVPLRAAHQVLNEEGGPAPSRNGEAVRGLRLLLRARVANLAELSERVRRRLFEGGLDVAGHEPTELAALDGLLKHLKWRVEQDRSHALVRLASAHLASGDEAGASALLQEHPPSGDQAALAKRWLRALGGARIGPIALDERGPHRTRRQAPHRQSEDAAPPTDRWLRGFHVATQTQVRVRLGTPQQLAGYSSQVALWRSVLIPGVLRPLLAGEHGEQPYVAVRAVGHGLLGTQRTTRSPSAAREHAIEACALLHALAKQGVCLPDAEPRRFSLDECGRVWLTDLWGATPGDVDVASIRHAELVVGLIEQLLGHSDAVPSDASLPDIVRHLEPVYLPGARD